MRRVANLLSVVAVVLFAVGAMAQTMTDFSGRWTSEPEPTAAGGGGRAGATPGGRGGGGQRGGSGGGGSGDMGSGWGSNITVTQDTNRLTVEYMFFTSRDMQPPLKFVYALDGSETKNSVMMGRGIQVQTSKTAWDGDKLVITTVHGFAHSETGQPMKIEVKQTLSLESPTSMIVEATRSGVLGGQPSTTKTVYKKNWESVGLTCISRRSFAQKVVYQSAKRTNDSSPAVHCWEKERKDLQSVKRTAE